MELLAQGIGLVAMFMNIWSYQQKKQRTVIIYQFFGSLLFAIHFTLLGATLGGILNGLGIVRALVYSNRERTRAEKPIWLWVFGAAFLLAYISSFLWFGVSVSPKNLILEALPAIAMLATTVSFRFTEAAMIRRLGAVSSPLWLIYNIFNFSIGGICCEVLNLLSILTAVIRLDRGKRE